MFPNMSEAFCQLTQTIQFQIVSKSVVDFEASEDENRKECFEAVIEPIQEKKLLIKPEGQRSWKWWTMWTKKSLPLDTIIIDSERKKYRVMSDRDWGNAEYYEYELTETTIA